MTKSFVNNTLKKYQQLSDDKNQMAILVEVGWGEISSKTPLVSMNFSTCSACIITNEKTGKSLLMNLNDDCVNSIHDHEGFDLKSTRYDPFIREEGKKTAIVIRGRMGFDRSKIMLQMQNDGVYVQPEIKLDTKSNLWGIVFEPATKKLYVDIKNKKELTVQAPFSQFPTEAIIKLITAGADRPENMKLALFTGGPNGGGKTTLLHKHIEPHLLQNGLKPRDSDKFHETLAELVMKKELFQEYANADIATIYDKNKVAAGQQLWKNILKDFPELQEIKKANLTLVNMDLVAYCLPECRAEKAELKEQFLIREHYYNALNHMPELINGLIKAKTSFTVDSTMSNPEKSIEASNIAKKNGYNVATLLLYSEDKEVALQRTLIRGVELDRKIRSEDVLASQKKLPTNYPKYIKNALRNDIYICLIETSTSDYKNVASVGDIPAEINMGIFKQSSAKKLTLHDPSIYNEFKKTTRTEIS